MQAIYPIKNINEVQVIESRIIAEALGIKHKNLLETIDKYIDSIQGQFGQVAFETEAGYNNSRVRVAYLTEDQSLFIGSLSKNTPKVVEFKANLVKSFQAARKAISPKSSNSQLSLARQLLEALEAQEERLTYVEEKTKLIEAKIDTIDTNFISVIGFARVNGISLPSNEALKLGKRAGKLSREMGFTIGKVFDAKYGSVNTYHKDVLQTVFQNSTAI